MTFDDINNFLEENNIFDKIQLIKTEITLSNRKGGCSFYVYFHLKMGEKEKSVSTMQLIKNSNEHNNPILKTQSVKDRIKENIIQFVMHHCKNMSVGRRHDLVDLCNKFFK